MFLGVLDVGGLLFCIVGHGKVFHCWWVVGCCWMLLGVVRCCWSLKGFSVLVCVARCCWVLLSDIVIKTDCILSNPYFTESLLLPGNKLIVWSVQYKSVKIDLKILLKCL